MNSKIENLGKKIAYSPLSPIFSLGWTVCANMQHLLFNIKWKIRKVPMPTEEEAQEVKENVTFIFKSFERKRCAKKLCRNLQRFYPGVRIIIADDSKKSLKIKNKYVKIIHLPFNSGLSKGLNEVLKLVETPFTVRMDDDVLLTPYTQIHKHLKFLKENTDIDLVGVMMNNSHRLENWQSKSKGYFAENMEGAPKALKIPHGTFLDNNYVVLGKVPNVFITRTEKYQALGYDDNIRMIDHFEFFFRAAGNLVSVLSLDSFALHYHNPFNKRYRKFRSDIGKDSTYIKGKYPDYFRKK